MRGLEKEVSLFRRDFQDSRPGGIGTSGSEFATGKRVQLGSWIETIEYETSCEGEVAIAKGSGSGNRALPGWAPLRGRPPEKFLNRREVWVYLKRSSGWNLLLEFVVGGSIGEERKEEIASQKPPKSLPPPAPPLHPKKGESGGDPSTVQCWRVVTRFNSPPNSPAGLCGERLGDWSRLERW